MVAARPATRKRKRARLNFMSPPLDDAATGSGIRHKCCPLDNPANSVVYTLSHDMDCATPLRPTAQRRFFAQPLTTIFGRALTVAPFCPVKRAGRRSAFALQSPFVAV